MRAKYKNPKDLGISLKDLVDLYQDNLMEFDHLEEKVTKIVEASKEIFYKNGKIATKIADILEPERIEIINGILAEK
ncbi:TIGR04540 family protein [Clostridium mediterraneense]|uniref:TIGR04540 family protein n=1 Tax=Clostridium mediterraneense TaxID=1805472 RepID=UPI00083400DE|nr:TIGR04540 family protein [Clostridium mediterraneense]